MTRLCEEIRLEAVARGKGKQAEALYNILTGASQYPEAARQVLMLLSCVVGYRAVE